MKRPLPRRQHVSHPLPRHSRFRPIPVWPFRPLAPFAHSPIHPFTHSPKAVPFSATVHSIFGTNIKEQRTLILSSPKILHHEFLLEKHPKIRGGKGSKKQRGITAA
jgi:hypothetical protein